MNGLFSGEMMDLMSARKTRGGDDRIRGRLTHRRQKLSLADGPRQIVVLALVSKRACHATAAGVKVRDLSTGNLAKQANHRGGSNERLLMAVSMDEHLLWSCSKR